MTVSTIIRPGVFPAALKPADILRQKPAVALPSMADDSSRLPFSGVPRAYILPQLQFGRQLRSEEDVKQYAADFRARTKNFLFPFQRKAIQALAAGKSVVVSAPTSSGKTLVAEAAIEDALSSGQRVFYTSPKKALSNDKFLELRARFGHDKIGLLTGDVSVNSNAPIVIMTTEVFRDMAARPKKEDPGFQNLKYVVFDECHNVGDEDRGVVWEESAIFARRNLPGVQQIHLSATVKNAEQYTAWLDSLNGAGTRAGEFKLVTSKERPVPLTMQYLAVDLAKPSRDEKAAKNTRNGQKGRQPEQQPKFSTRLVNIRANNGQLSPEFEAAFKRTEELRLSGQFPSHIFPQGRAFALKGKKQLPAIDVIMSQDRCEENADLLLSASHLDLMDPKSSRYRELHRIIDAYVQAYPSLAQSRLLEYLDRGIGFHHGNMWPPEKELLQVLLKKDLIQYVYSTTGLTEGINVPAQTVVVTDWVIHTTEGRRPLTPSEFQQAVGRAGRLGMHPMGYAALGHPTYDEVAESRDVKKQFMAMVNSEAGAVESQFRITPASVLNLHANFPRTQQMHQFIRQSFKAFQAGPKDSPASTAMMQSLENQLLNYRRFLSAAGFLTLSQSGESLLTGKGQRAQIIPWDTGILVANLVESGLLEQLDPASLAGVMAATVAQRPKDRNECSFARPEIADAVDQLYAIRQDLETQAAKHGLSVTPDLMLDPTLVGPVTRWCNTHNPALLAENPGKSLRIILRTANLLRHVTEMPGISEQLKENAKQAVDLLIDDFIKEQIHPKDVQI